MTLRKTSWRFYGLSLLLSFDPTHIGKDTKRMTNTDNDNINDEVTCDCRKEDRIDIRLIDFAKCERRDPVAENKTVSTLFNCLKGHGICVDIFSPYTVRKYMLK